VYGDQDDVAPPLTPGLIIRGPQFSPLPLHLTYSRRITARFPPRLSELSNLLFPLEYAPSFAIPSFLRHRFRTGAIRSSRRIFTFRSPIFCRRLLSPDVFPCSLFLRCQKKYITGPKRNASSCSSAFSFSQSWPSLAIPRCYFSDYPF